MNIPDIDYMPVRKKWAYKGLQENANALKRPFKPWAPKHDLTTNPSPSGAKPTGELHQHDSDPHSSGIQGFTPFRPVEREGKEAGDHQVAIRPTRFLSLGENGPGTAEDMGGTRNSGPRKLGPLTNQKHEIFCQAIARGESNTEAYLKAYGGDASSAKAHGSRLVTNGNVKARIQELQQQAADDTVLSLRDRREMLKKIVHSKPKDAADDSELCELKMSKSGPYYAFPDKLRALELDSKLAGDFGPEEKKDSKSLPISMTLINLIANLVTSDSHLRNDIIDLKDV